MAKEKIPITKKKAAEEKEKKPVAVEEDDKGYWDTEDELEEHMNVDVDEEKVDVSKLKFTKIADLSRGMDDVNVEAEIDFVGELMGRGFGEEPRAIGFIKDDTGEIKMAFWGDDARTAKKGKKIRVVKGYVSEYNGQIQLNASRGHPIEFI